MKFAIPKYLSRAGGLAVSAAEFSIPVETYKAPRMACAIILSQDNAVPVVTVYMIFDVGARSEEKGRTGFAHLFEHMMFEKAR